MPIKERTTRTTIQRTQLELTCRDLIELLRKAGYVVPDSATATLQVPSGGDYSGCVLDVDADSPVVVRWNLTVGE